LFVEHREESPQDPTEVYALVYSLVEDVPRGTVEAFGFGDRDGSPFDFPKNLVA
jgi:hypothetical protein